VETLLKASAIMCNGCANDNLPEIKAKLVEIGYPPEE
jgi:hypothetical protein